MVTAVMMMRVMTMLVVVPTDGDDNNDDEGDDNGCCRAGCRVRCRRAMRRQRPSRWASSRRTASCWSPSDQACRPWSQRPRTLPAPSTVPPLPASPPHQVSALRKGKEKIRSVHSLRSTFSSRWCPFHLGSIDLSRFFQCVSVSVVY